jgi:hypothetical protein
MVVISHFSSIQCTAVWGPTLDVCEQKVETRGVCNAPCAGVAVQEAKSAAVQTRKGSKRGDEPDAVRQCSVVERTPARAVSE